MDDISTFARNILTTAGEILKKEQAHSKILTHKIGRDFATNADYDSEKYLIGEIKKNYPTHNIFSEEIGADKGENQYTWVIDPIDGTREFSYGLPHYGINLALEYNGELIYGIMYEPATGFFYEALHQKGSCINTRKIEVSDISKLSDSIVFIRDVSSLMNDREKEKYPQLMTQLIDKVYRLRGLHWDVMGLIRIACKYSDGFVILPVNGKYPAGWYDVAPGIIILREAGGTITDLRGEPIVNRNLDHGLVATNGVIHDSLLEIIQKYYSASIL